jgi:hypothetical protein
MKKEEAKKIEQERFEFVLYINDNIICQRYFPINNFNPNSVKSYEIKELMDNICGMNNGQYGTMGIIPTYLKNKTIEFMLANSHYFMNQSEQAVKQPSDKEDNFSFEIKIDRKTVAKSIFSGTSFHQKFRYAVDIKEIIPDIISEIRSKLSKKNYTKTYLNISI